MQTEERFLKMGVDCDSFPSRLGLPSNHPLGQPRSRSSSNRLVLERRQETQSLRNQAILKASEKALRERNPECYEPRQSSNPKSLLSLHTTSLSDFPSPPLPVAKSKHLSRSATFSSLESKTERNLHSDYLSDRSSFVKLPLSGSGSDTGSNTLKPSEKEPSLPSSSQQATRADGPEMSVKSLFRSSSFTSNRVPIVDSSDSQPTEAPSVATASEPMSSIKSFFRSSSFVHKSQEISSPIAKSLSRSLSSLSNHGQESAKEQKADSSSGFSKWARSFRFKPTADVGVEISESSPYSLFSGPSGKRASAKVSPIEGFENSFGVLTKGFIDSSRNAVKAVQDKARHLVSQNKHWYQDGQVQLDIAYITENIIAVGFPGAESSSNILGFAEGNYQGHLEELVTFCENQHPGKYKIFNLCSEKLYDASFLHDKVAYFPIRGNNCPLKLLSAFCEAAYTWLKEGLENVAVVHCKGGMERTGLMTSCLLLHLRFFPSAEESINHYNLKRCAGSSCLELPSQLRYVKYYEQVSKKYHGCTPTGRKCTLRSIRLNNCPAWIRPSVTVSDHNVPGVLFASRRHPNTSLMLTEDLWLSAMKSGVYVLELPEDGHAAVVDGDFKVHFQNRHVDFSCWLNSNMEGNIIFRVEDLDGFDKEVPNFEVELELEDMDLPVLKTSTTWDRDSTSLRSCFPSAIASSKTSSCTDTATDIEGEAEECLGVSTRPYTDEQDTIASTSHMTLQLALSNAVSDVSTGIFNAVDRLRSHTRSASMPSSPRLFSDQYNRGFARSDDNSKVGWSAGSSRLQSLNEGLQEKTTHAYDKSGSANINSFTSGRGIDDFTVCDTEFVEFPLDFENPSSPVRVEDEGSSFRIEDDVSVMSSDSCSDFQALAVASAADTSLFTFADEEDYESDEM
ncbi:uncharacterized protein [Physcomitrium patens]|uniref:uncharacterized protein isoform X3 n=1 Tax=Physcomitrium patens TaxID=3218 RepID=UPI003CCC9F85